jgi:toxin FitB
MNVVDSSAWLEYFADGPNAGAFSQPIEAISRLLVPTICMLEVFKRLYSQRGENDALRAIAVMRQGRQIDLPDVIALNAARISIEHRLPLADSVILATTREYGATLRTQNADFDGIADVRYLPKSTNSVNEAGSARYKRTPRGRRSTE